jgi:hypothetical protein
MLSLQTKEMAMATAKKAVAKKVVAPKASVKRAAAPVVEPRHDRVDWRSLYLYAVSLITLMVCLFTVISIINGIVDFVLPQPEYYYDSSTLPAGMTKESYRQQIEDDNQRRAIKSLIGSVALFAAALPLYLYHWKAARKSH